MEATINGRLLELVVGDIAQQAVDAIVNAANSRLAGGGGGGGGGHPRGTRGGPPLPKRRAAGAEYRCVSLSTRRGGPRGGNHGGRVSRFAPRRRTATDRAPRPLLGRRAGGVRERAGSTPARRKRRRVNGLTTRRRFFGR